MGVDHGRADVSVPELPSLKEFELLAREALGSDEGIAPAGEAASDEWRVAGERKPGAEAGDAGEARAAAAGANPPSENSS